MPRAALWIGNYYRELRLIDHLNPCLFASGVHPLQLRRSRSYHLNLLALTEVATVSARYHKDGAEILVDRHPERPRRLTPRECSRLMGFDKPGRSDFRIPVSDTQAYRQFGNSVAVPVVSAILDEVVYAMSNGHPRLGDRPIQFVMGSG